MNARIIPEDAHCCVYHLHLDHHALDQGYVGVSYSPKKRMAQHRRGKFTVGNALRKHGSAVILTVLLRATRKECLILEEELRPQPNMGWNQSAGGHHGPVLRGSDSPFWKGGVKCPTCSKPLPKRRLGTYCLTCRDTRFVAGQEPHNAAAVTYDVIRPDGRSDYTCNLTAYCEENGLIRANARKVANGLRTHTKGFVFRKRIEG